MTIFVIWQLIVTLDSIRNSCDVYHTNVTFYFPIQLVVHNHKCNQISYQHIQKGISRLKRNQLVEDRWRWKVEDFSQMRLSVQDQSIHLKLRLKKIQEY